MPSSNLKLSGQVQHVVKVPNTPDLVLVVEDNLSQAAGESVSKKLSKNVLLILLEGDWSLSCSFVLPGDAIEMTRFDMDLPPPRNAISDVPSASLSNAPQMVALVERESRTVLPRTTLCVRPSAATELIVIRNKRVVINFANVGNLSLLDVTDKEQKKMESDFLDRSGSAASGQNQIQPQQKNLQMRGLLPPTHHNEARFNTFSVGSPLRQRGGTGGTPMISLGRGADGTPTSSRRVEGSVFEGATGVAGKNCYTGMDRYYDVYFGQSSRINPHVAFLERVMDCRGNILDAGSGSGLYAFTLRAMGVTSVTCLEKSITMLRILEEKNRFFELVESDLPERQQKGRIRCLAGDITRFSLSRVDSATGEQDFEDFSTVLCLGVISHLPNLEAVSKALHCLSLHTRVGGKLILSVPNAEVVLRRGHTQAHSRFEVDHASTSMCAGATSAMPSGVVDVVSQSLIKQPPSGVSADPSSVHPLRRSADVSDGFGRMETTFHGCGFHPNSSTEDGVFVPFKDHVTELLLPAAVVEDAATKCGYVMEGLYGSLAGATFSAKDSEERVYIFRRKEDQFAVAE